MLAALDAVLNKQLSGNKAAALHGVLPSTLKDGYVVHSRKPGRKLYLSKQEEEELMDHLLLAAKVGYGKTRWDVMNLMETYVNSQPLQIEAQTTTTATDSRPPQIKVQMTVTASKFSQIKAQKPVTISNGW